MLESPDKFDHERFWMYFQLDKDRLYFGKRFGVNFINGEDVGHYYYGDVLNRMIDSESFISYSGYKEPLKDIFRNSDFISALRKSAGMKDGERQETFLSFSLDVDRYACSLFIQLLIENGFDVKAYSFLMEDLCLRYNLRFEGKKPSGYTVVMSAMDQNFHILISSALGGREKKDIVLNNLGRNFFRDKIVRFTLKQFVRSKDLVEEKVDEMVAYLRSTDKPDRWLQELYADPAASGANLSTDFTYKSGTFQVWVDRKDFETQELKHDLIDKITTSITREIGDLSGVGYILCLGEIFGSNVMEMLRRELSVNTKLIMKSVTELSDIVRGLTEYDTLLSTSGLQESQSEFDHLVENARIAQQRVEAKREEQRYKNNQQVKEDKESEAAHNEAVYKYAMAFAGDILKRSQESIDYILLVDVLDTALKYKPGDATALTMKADATTKRAEQDFANKRYEQFRKSADAHFAKREWEEADKDYKEALVARPNDRVVKERLTIISRRLQEQKEIERHRSKADLYLVQQNIDKALDELKQAQIMDPENKELNTMIDDLKQRKNEKEIIIPQLINELEEDVDKGNWQIASDKLSRVKEMCPNADIDFEKIERKIGVGLAALEKEKKEEEEQRKVFLDYKKKAQKDNLGGNLHDALNWIDKALELFPKDESMLSMKEKVLSRLSTKAEFSKNKPVAKTHKASDLGSIDATLNRIGKVSAKSMQSMKEKVLSHLSKTEKSSNDETIAINYNGDSNLGNIDEIKKKILAIKEKDKFEAVRTINELKNKGIITMPEFEELKLLIKKK